MTSRPEEGAKISPEALRSLVEALSRALAESTKQSVESTEATQSTSAGKLDFGFLRIRSGDHNNSLSEVLRVLELLDSLNTAAVLAQINLHNEQPQRVHNVQRAKHASSLKSIERAITSFLHERPHFTELFEVSEDEGVSDTTVLAQRLAASALLKEVVRNREPSAYQRFFESVQIETLSHNSPLLLEIAVPLGVLGATGMLIWGLLRAVAMTRRLNAEAHIRELEAKERAEMLEQRRLQTKILSTVQRSIEEANGQGMLPISEKVLMNVTKIASPTIAELGSTHMIGSLTIGTTISALK